MNLCDVSTSESGQSVVRFSCISPVVGTAFRHNIVRALASWFRSECDFDNVMTKFMINDRTDA